MICSDDASWSAPSHHGELPAGSVTGSANGTPPSGSETRAIQSHSSTARGDRTGATSAIASNAWRAAPGWLSGDRRSASSPQP